MSTARSVSLVGGAFVCLILIAGCGDESRTPSATAPPNAVSTPTASATEPTSTPTSTDVVGAADSSLGRILVNADGKTVYLLTADTSTTDACVGKCLASWPIVPAPATLPTSIPGVGGTFGKHLRADGAVQLTLNGHALYTFTRDTAPGDTKGQGSPFPAGHNWLVISSSGEPITARPRPTMKPTSGSGYGY